MTKIGNVACGCIFDTETGADIMCKECQQNRDAYIQNAYENSIEAYLNR